MATPQEVVSGEYFQIPNHNNWAANVNPNVSGAGEKENEGYHVALVCLNTFHCYRSPPIFEGCGDELAKLFAQAPTPLDCIRLLQGEDGARVAKISEQPESNVRIALSIDDDVGDDSSTGSRFSFDFALLEEEETDRLRRGISILRTRVDSLENRLMLHHQQQQQQQQQVFRITEFENGWKSRMMSLNLPRAIVNPVSGSVRLIGMVSIGSLSAGAVGPVFERQVICRLPKPAKTSFELQGSTFCCAGGYSRGMLVFQVSVGASVVLEGVMPLGSFEYSDCWIALDSICYGREIPPTEQQQQQQQQKIVDECEAEGE